MNNLNTFNQYDNNFIINENDENYLNKLSMFFNKNPKQKCPTNSKGIIQKYIENNNYIMSCSNDNSWKIKITPTKYINLKRENVISSYNEGDKSTLDDASNSEVIIKEQRWW